MIRFIYIILFCITVSEAISQDYTTYNYSVLEGLPSSEVYEIYEDRSGFVWFATDNGVARFDGKEIKPFHVKDGLTDPVVFGFFEDPRGRIWFRTFSGKLCFYEDGKIEKYRFNNILLPITSIGLIDFFVTDKDEVWFGVRNIVGKIDANGVLDSTRIKIKGLYYKQFGRNHILTSTNDYFNTKWIIINDEKFGIIPGDSIFQNRVFRTAQWNDKLYLNLGNDLYEYADHHLVKKISGKAPIISLYVDGANQLWIGYLNAGVERYDKDFTNRWEPDFLRKKSVTKVYHDQDDGLWFTTLESGVFHVPTLLIRNYSVPTEARIRAVLALRDSILVGDQAGNLHTIDVTSKQSHVSKHFPAPILSIYRNSNNKFWISSNSIHLYDATFNLVKEYPGIAIDYSEDKQGTTWTYGGNSIKRFDERGSLMLEKLLHVSYRNIHTDDSLLYFGDRTGLHVRNKQLDIINVPEDFDDYKISNISALTDSVLLISTIGNGFILLNRYNWTNKHYNSQNNFIADNIYATLIYKNEIWIATEKGIIVSSIKSLLDQRLSFKFLTKRSGLINDKIDLLIQHEGNIWAFSDNVYSIIPGAFNNFANQSPKFYLKEFLVNNQPIDISESIDLASDQNNIALSFGYISFNNQNILLRYRMSPKDTWIYTESRELRSSSLSPGVYAFELQYSADNNLWKSAMPVVAFVVHPQWWNQWYVQALAFILLSLFIYFYVKYQRSVYKQHNKYLQIINEHQQKLLQSEIATLERERNRIAKELHDGAGTNLTALKLRVSQLLQSHRDPLAAEVEEQFQIAIHEIKDIIYGLAPPSLERYGLFTALKNYITKLNKSVPLNISLKTFGTEITGYELNIVIFRIVQELITNSVKHSYAKSITIHINAFEDVMNIVYEDDGIGFALNHTDRGLGLDNIESRIRSLQGTLRFESGQHGISYIIDIPIKFNKEVL